MRKHLLPLLFVVCLVTGCSSVSPVSLNKNKDKSSAVSKVKDDVKIEEDEKILTNSVETAKDISKAINKINDIKSGKVRKSLGKNVKTILLNAAVDAYYNKEEKDSWLINDADWKSVSDILSVDDGTLAQFEFGVHDSDSTTVSDGDYAGYSLGNFLFVLGSVKDYQLTGWYYAYDQITTDMYMCNADTGEKINLYGESGNFDGLSIEVIDDLVRVKDDNNRLWRVDMSNGNVEYTNGDTFFTGNEYYFNAKMNGLSCNYRMFGGTSVDGVDNYIDFWEDQEQFKANMESIRNCIQEDAYTEIQHLIADSVGGAISSLPFLEVIDTLSNGNLSKEFSRSVIKNFDRKDTDKSEIKSDNEKWSRVNISIDKFHNYYVGLINNNELDDSVVSDEDAKKMSKMDKNEKIRYKLQKQKEKINEYHKKVKEKYIKKLEDEGVKIKRGDDKKSSKNNSSKSEKGEEKLESTWKYEGMTSEEINKAIKKESEEKKKERQKITEKYNKRLQKQLKEQEKERERIRKKYAKELEKRNKK